jgi:hypothetical protein
MDPAKRCGEGRGADDAQRPAPGSVARTQRSHYAIELMIHAGMLL